MMNMRAIRSFQGRRITPAIIKRFKREERQINPLPGEYRYISAKPGTRPPDSPVHPLLGEGYEVGGHLKRGISREDEFDDEGRQTWGEWGIPVNIYTSKGDKTFNM
jgi:hypothetical protein